MALFVLAACGPDGGGSADPAPPAAGRFEGDLFTEQAAATGLDFVHFNGMSGEYYYVEIMGGGAALFDYDADGDLDVYLVQGHMLGPGKTLGQATFAPRGSLADRLFRNDLEVGPDGRRTLRFTDVTKESGIEAPGYGMGVAVGDYDNDGLPDLYVTQWNGPNLLFHNDGGGTFTDVTERAGVGERRWSVAAAFFDYDRDGWLDLYVANYLDFTYATHKECTNDVGLRDYCGPVSYKPVPDALFRNRGDGTFEDVTGRAGITGEPGPALGVVTGDFDGNGHLDVYVANDEKPNNLWLNRGDGTFRDEALLAGAAVNAEGHAEAGMGVDAADVEGDGDEDLFISHLTGETNTLYLNDGRGLFTDASAASGLGPPSWEYTGFGAGFLDVENDGRPDALVANGAIKIIKELLVAGDPFPLHQKNQLFANRGGGRFEEVTDTAGAAFALSEVSRGAAFGDLDNDGDTDVVIHNNAGPVRLLRNEAGHRRSWVGLRLTGPGGRDALGAWAELAVEGSPPRVDRVRTEGSYASASDPRLLFGLGAGGEVRGVRVTWPDGTVEEWDEIPENRYTTLSQGSGRKAAPAP